MNDNKLKDDFIEELDKLKDIIVFLQKVEDSTYNKFIKKHNEVIKIAKSSDLEHYIFDYCFNSFGSIDKIKSLMGE